MNMMMDSKPPSETIPLQSPQQQPQHQHPQPQPPPPPPPPPSSFAAAAAAAATRPRTRPTSILSFTNGALKRHPLYRECLRNHAAALGGHALDGCGEFMPSPLSSPSDPTSLKCAACGCHRNFHRREDDHDLEDDDDAAEFTPTKRRSTSHSPPPPLAASPAQCYPSAPQMLMALSAGLSGPDADNVPTTPNASLSAGRKRFRTKFSKEQKEKMQAFSEKLGWKMQKKDEKMVEDFCNEIGVGRSVLKVWMHNNKHNFAKKDGLILPLNTATSNVDNNSDNNNNNNSCSAHVMNGSSSSS